MFDIASTAGYENDTYKGSEDLPYLAVVNNCIIVIDTKLGAIAAYKGGITLSKSGAVQNSSRPKISALFGIFKTVDEEKLADRVDAVLNEYNVSVREQNKDRKLLNKVSREARLGMRKEKFDGPEDEQPAWSSHLERLQEDRGSQKGPRKA